MEPTEHPPETSTPKTNREDLLSLPAERIFQLQRIQALEDVKTDLIKWAKGRFWLITVATLLIGAFGGYSLIKTTVRDLLEKEVDSAKKDMLSASYEARSAGAAASSIIKQAESYGNTVAALNKKAEGVDLQLVTLQQKIQAETSNARALAIQELKGFSARLATLESLVTNLAKESKENTQLIARYQSEIKTLNDKSEAVMKRFLENANYNTAVVFTPRAEKLSRDVTARLTQAGFKTSSTPVPTPIVPSFEEKLSNSISYVAEAAPKVKEIQELLAPVVRFKETKELKPLSSTELGKIPLTLVWEFAPSRSTIRITLVDDK